MEVWRTPPPPTMEVLDGADYGGALGHGAKLQLFGDGADERGKMAIL